ncbi:MAG: hypothetical protein JNN03_22655 [Rubrivivax sp.]|nr:hypothetical protein [Rubrivivax sp.]
MARDDTAPQARNRATLRKYFASGSRPTAAEFAELIESMLNMQDEGFAKTPDDGLKVTSAVNEPALLTFFRAEQGDHGLWSVRYGGLGEPRPGDRVAVGGGDRRQRNPLAVLPLPPPESEGGVKPDPAGLSKIPPLIALHQDGRVSVGKHAADHMLDVQGMVAARGRVGTYPVPDAAAVKADGEWKDVTGPLHGCVAFEVTASVGVTGSGHHATLHAMALNAHNPTFTGLLGWLAQHRPFGWIERRLNGRKRIRSQHAWFGERCDRLELQWAGLSAQGDARPFRLQIRTRCSYQGTPPIHLHVTQLWPIVVDAGSGPTP